MARNRKRAKDRRPRRPTTDPGSGRGVATARGARGPAADRGQSPDVRPAAEGGQAPGADRAAPGGAEPGDVEPDGALDAQTSDSTQRTAPDEALDTATPGAIEHATPDVELAEAQLALGRAEVAGETPSNYREPDGEAGDEFGEPFEADIDPDSEGFADGGGEFSDRGEGGRRARSGELARSAGAAPAPHSLPGGRLVNFLQGSWRELQRVQWPDRRQVMQATGVVIGFVIVAGVFLGLADLIATNVVNYILK